MTNHRIKKVTSINDLPPELRDTPIECLFRYHNLAEEFKDYADPQMIVVMCMDNRKQLKIPNKFTYIIRTPGARITGYEFSLSFPIGLAELKHVALIAHTHCGMVKLVSKKDKVVNGLEKITGWSHEDAENHFNTFAPFYEIENEVDFVADECERLKHKYPNVVFVPLLYSVDDHKLNLIQ